MWPFKKKIAKLGESGFYSGLTDWHSHILPGVDDGFPTMEKSLEVLSEFEKLGVKDIWLTPHIMEDYPNTPKGLQQRFNELLGRYKGPIRLNLAAEHMLDALFQDRLSDNNVLPIGKERNYLLVETSYFNPPMDFDSLLDEILSKGYYPLLAHPERYRYMDEKKYKELRDRGIRFQLNYLSLLGGYGTFAQAKSEWLLKNEMIDVIGSDIHRLDAFQQMSAPSPRKQEHLDRILEIAKNPRLT